MSRCPPDQDLSAFLNGTLPTGDLATVAAHVRNCLVCDGKLSDLRSGEAPSVARPAAELTRPDIGGDKPIALISISVAAPEATLPRLGPYRLLKKLGQGGMGAVYQARHELLDRIEAVKILPRDLTRDRQAVERFEREMRAVAKLDHPHIVRAFHADEEQGQHYLVMECVDGLDVGTLVRQVGRLRISDACEIVRQAADGLQHAHENGMVHRDLKPSNLIVSRKGIVKILDLGLALMGGDSGLSVSDLTSTGQIMGTLDYMAPEQGGNSHEVDIRADLYSLGASLYCLLAGRPPFGDAEHANRIKKLCALANEEPRAVRDLRDDVPEELAKLVHRLLAKIPQQRPTKPEELEFELRQFCHGSNLRMLVAQSSVATMEGAVLPAASTVDFSALPLGGTQRSIESLKPQALPSIQINVDSRRTRIQPSTKWNSGRKTLIGVLAVILIALSSMVIRVATDKGDVVITSDNSVKVAVKKSGRTVDEWEVKQGDNRFTLWSGAYAIELSGKYDGVRIKDGQFVLSRGKSRQVRIELVPKVAAVKPSDTSEERISPQSKSNRSMAKEYVSPSSGMRFVQIPAGTFQMGSTLEQARQVDAAFPGFGASMYEVPQHAVRISQPFKMGVFEVTQEEYEQVMGANPSWFSKTGKNSAEVIDQDTRRFPVEYVTWLNAVVFCNELSKRDRLPAAYRLNNIAQWGAMPQTIHKADVELTGDEGYRLPTEAEWEYACRANSRTVFSFGDSLNGTQENVDGTEPFGTNQKGPHLGRPAVVGSYPKNAFGLHDMHGNVSEWCQDGWERASYSSQSTGVTDPLVTRGDISYIQRGGSFDHKSIFARSANRSSPGHITSRSMGFRVVLGRTDHLREQGTPAAPKPAAPLPKPAAVDSIKLNPPLPAVVPVKLDLKPMPVELAAGSPICPSALVSQPQPIPGVISWTIQLARPLMWENDMQFSPNGQTFATGGLDRTVRIWDSAGRKLHKALLSPTTVGNAAIESVSWSACGRYIAATHLDEGVRIWLVNTGQPVAWIAAPVKMARWSLDNRYLALVQDQEIALWDATQQKISRTFTAEGLAPEFRAVDWSPSGKELVAASQKGGVRIYNVENGSVRQLNSAPVNDARGVDWSPDSRMVAVVGAGRNVLVIDVAADQIEDRFTTEDASASDVSWSPDGRFIALRGPFIRNVAARQTHLNRDGLGTTAFAWTPDSTAIFETLNGGQMSRHEVLESKSTLLLVEAQFTIDQLSWSPDGSIFALHHSRNGNGPIHGWQTESSKSIHLIGSGSGSYTWAQSGRNMILRKFLPPTPSSLDFWDPVEQSRTMSLPIPQSRSLITAIKSDGSQLASLDGDKKLRIWNPQAQAIERTIPFLGEMPTFYTLAYSPNGQWLAFGGYRSGTVHAWIWNTSGWNVIERTWPNSWGSDVIWSPDSQVLAIGGQLITLPAGSEQPDSGPWGRLMAWSGEGRKVYVDAGRWTLDESGQTRTVAFHPDGIWPSRYAFSPDERLLAMSDSKGIATIWHVPDLRRVVSLTLLPASQRPLAISADGHYRSDSEISSAVIYIVQTASGQQTYTALEFEKRYKWENDRSRVVIPRGR